MISNTLDFENLKHFDLIDSLYVRTKNNKYDSIVRIYDKESNSFGTGFVIDEDSEGSYILTGSRILEYAKKLVIDELAIEIIAFNVNDEIELAVIYVKKLFSLPFQLSSSLCENTNVAFRGYSIFTKDKFIIKTQEALLVNGLSVMKNVEHYQIELEGINSIEKGMTGSPLFCPESGDVIGVLSIKKGNKIGYVIPIFNLPKIWEDMPKDLLSKENNMTEEIEVTAGSTTLLIYMAADNDLDNFAEKDLETIKEASYGSDMNIVIQFDRNEFVDASNTVRLSIKNGEVLSEVDLGETNTGDPTVLKAFIEESVEAYPSDKLIVIVWSHGSGVDDADVYDTERIRERYFVPPIEIEEIAVGFDDSAGDFLDNLELQKALDVSVNIDVLGFDACLMGMFEILYQLKDQTSVMVASQHLEPASGWDYQRILNELDTSATASKMGQQFITFHDEHHNSNERRDVTQSALHTVVIDEVTKDLDMFAKVLREELKKGEQKQSRKDLEYTLRNSQFFNRKDYVDLMDFVRKAKNRLQFEALESHADKLLSSLETLVLANHTIGHFMEDANGVSIYFPNAGRPFKDTFEMYEKLDFAEACPNWLKLIKWYWL